MEENTGLRGENQSPLQEENINTENINTESLAGELSLEDQLAQQKDQYIRLFAEFENYKKRTQKERLDFAQYANQNLMVSMLAVLDDFERALREFAKVEENNDQMKGVELIYNKFRNTLIEKGLKTMEIKSGDDFSVDYHEAITQIPAPTEDLRGKIVDVIETGYQLHDRVIRFAKVVIGN